MRRNKRKLQIAASSETTGVAPADLTRQQLINRAKAAGLPGIVVRWKTETIINKLKELNYAV